MIAKAYLNIPSSWIFPSATRMIKTSLVSILLEVWFSVPYGGKACIRHIGAIMSGITSHCTTELSSTRRCNQPAEDAARGVVASHTTMQGERHVGSISVALHVDAQANTLGLPACCYPGTWIFIFILLQDITQAFKKDVPRRRLHHMLLRSPKPAQGQRFVLELFSCPLVTSTPPIQRTFILYRKCHI